MPDDGVLVRFWSLDHHAKTEVNWPLSDWSKLVYASEGTILVESKDQVCVLPPNRAIWVEPRTRHRMTSFGPTKVRTLYFRSTLGVENSSRPIHVRALMKELILETCKLGPLMAGDDLHAAMYRMLCHEIVHAAALPAVIQLPTDELARKGARLVLEDLLRWTQVSELASEVGCSKRTLERRFQAETGMSLGRWFQQARLLKSLHYLAAKETVAEAAFQVGYSGPSAYIHAFKTQFGVTPSEWR